MYLWHNPTRDQQEQPSVGTCARCNRELYPSDDGELCADCKKELKQYDPRTVTAVMDAMDFELKKYLSDDLRNKVWNALLVQFPVEEMEE